MKRIASILLLLVSATAAARAKWSDSTNYFIKLSSTNSINRANDKSAFLFDNSLGLSIRKERVSLNWNNTWLYGQQDGTKSNNDFSTTFDANFYRPGRKFFYW